MAIKPEVIDELLKACKTKEDILGEKGLLKQLVKALAERALQAEMSNHLGYEKYEASGKNSGNSRNGCSTKTIKGEFGETDITVPRDRNGSFEPQFIPKGQSRFDSFDQKILALYARGMTTRDIQAQLKDLYGTDVSATLISQVTDAIMDEVKLWQSRPLEVCYPIIYFDALMVKIHHEKQIINKAIYLALGINLEGQKELLGMWCSQHEGARFWLHVLTELKNRGLQEVLICCVDGLNGFPDAIQAVYPKAKTQLCIVHLIRQSLRYVSWKDRKAIVADLKKIYGATTVEEAELALSAFAETWDRPYPAISQCWRRHWENIIPFFAYPPEIRRVIYTTNTIESLNMSLRKVIKNKRVFPYPLH